MKTIYHQLKTVHLFVVVFLIASGVALIGWPQAWPDARLWFGIAHLVVGVVVGALQLWAKETKRKDS